MRLDTLFMWVMIVISFIVFGPLHHTQSVQGNTLPSDDWTIILQAAQTNYGLENQLVFSGTITTANVARIEAQLYHSDGSIKTIVLTSKGGDIAAAMELGFLIKSHHMNTEAKDYCVSACTIVFVSGERRSIPDGDRILGFHAPQFGGDPNNPADPAPLIQFYEDYGVTPDFATRAIRDQRPWYPDQDTLIHAHVITHIVIYVGNGLIYTPVFPIM